MTSDELDYWAQRGQAVAVRLIRHGVPAECNVRLAPNGDGEPVKLLDFKMGSIGKIIEAERIATELDRQRNEMMTAQASTELVGETADA